MKQEIKQATVQWPIVVQWDEYTTDTSPGVLLRRPVGLLNETTRAPRLPILELVRRHYGWI
jgi:hypothetical protein